MTNTFDFVMSTINNFTGDRNGILVAFVDKDFYNIEKNNVKILVTKLTQLPI